MYLSLFIFIINSINSEESVRCDGSLFGKDDLQIEVREKCGEPADVIRFSKYTIIHSKYLKMKKKENRLIEKYIYEYQDSKTYIQDLKEFENKNHPHDKILSEFEDSENAKDTNQNNSSSNDKKINKDEKIKTIQKRKKYMKESEIESIEKEYEIIWICRKYEDDFEQWIYNFGPNKFTRIITFLKGKIIEIETGDYGF